MERGARRSGRGEAANRRRYSRSANLVATATQASSAISSAARLASSYVLLRAGFRSTLFTASDEHFAHDPRGYVRALERFRFSNEQAQLVAAADGTKRVSDLLALTDLSEREALGMIVALEQLGFVEERKELPRSRRVSFGL